MSLVCPQYFDKDGRLKPLDAGYFVYTAICPMDESRALIKVGISMTPMDRLVAVHCGSPYSVELGAFCPVGKKRFARGFEIMVLSAYPDRATRGEWIDLPTDEASKKRFAKTCASIIYKITGKMPQWKQVTGAQIKEYMGLKRDLQPRPKRLTSRRRK